MSTAKQIIEEKMGADFLDAIFSATTDDTFSANINKALGEISELIEKVGTISVREACDILVKHNPNKQFDSVLFIGYANNGDTLTSEALIKFESDYFTAPSRYPHLRFGQALANKFNLSKKLSDEIFYEENTALVRSLVWTEVQGEYK